jgi:hypothetical protein
MPSVNERAVLIGLIREIVMMTSTRAVTDGDRILPVKELNKNAQVTLDRITQECDLVLGDYDIKELRVASREWAAWRKAKVVGNENFEAASE